jgi:hypothetical protein
MTVRRGAWLVVFLTIAAGCAGKGTNFAEMAPEAQLTQIQQELAITKATIADSDAPYHCCIEPTCNWCALMMAKCPCGHGLAQGKPVCPECVLGWRQGKGDIPGVESSAVKSMLAVHPSDDQEDGTHEHDEGHNHE